MTSGLCRLKRGVEAAHRTLSEAKTHLWKSKCFYLSETFQPLTDALWQQFMNRSSRKGTGSEGKWQKAEFPGEMWGQSELNCHTAARARSTHCLVSANIVSLWVNKHWGKKNTPVVKFAQKRPQDQHLLPAQMVQKVFGLSDQSTSKPEPSSVPRMIYFQPEHACTEHGLVHRTVWQVTLGNYFNKPHQRTIRRRASQGRRYWQIKRQHQCHCFLTFQSRSALQTQHSITQCVKCICIYLW